MKLFIPVVALWVQHGQNSPFCEPIGKNFCRFSLSIANQEFCLLLPLSKFHIKVTITILHKIFRTAHLLPLFFQNEEGLASIIHILPKVTYESHLAVSHL